MEDFRIKRFQSSKNGLFFLVYYMLFAVGWSLGTVICSIIFPGNYYDEFLIVLTPPVLYATQYYTRFVVYSSSLFAYGCAVLAGYFFLENSMESFVTITFIICAVLIAQELLYRAVQKQRHLYLENQRLTKDLEKSVNQIKRIVEILPLCSVCNKLRTDEEIWKEFERCLKEEFNTSIEPGICPDCLNELICDFTCDDQIKGDLTDEQQEGFF